MRFRSALAAGLIVLLPLSATATPLQIGSDFTLTVVTSTAGQVSSTTFTVVDGVDATADPVTFDLNTDGTDAFLFSIEPEAYCGLVACGAGGTVSYIFSGLTFEGGETLVSADASVAMASFQYVTVIDGSTVSFTFGEENFVAVDNMVLGGTFVTSAPEIPQVPLPATGGLLLAGLVALRRRPR